MVGYTRKELIDSLSDIDEGATRVRRGSVYKRIEELEKLDWDPICELVSQKGNTREEQIDAVIKSLRSPKPILTSAADKVIYYEYSKGCLKIDMKTGNVYAYGILEKGVLDKLENARRLRK